MIFKNYEYFIAIAEEGSISKAAGRLYISQPSLSKYLKRLEENIGEELFCRESYPLKLTRAGELYLSYVRDITKREKWLQEELSYLRSCETGEVSIGITVWRSSILMPVVMPVFKERYPRIKVSIQEGSHQHMASMLELGKADFSIFHLPNSYHDFTFEHLLFEKILFCVNRDNPRLSGLDIRNPEGINNMGNEEFRAFEDEGFILLKQGQNIRDITQNYLNKLRFHPDVILETSNIVTAMNMVKVGMGVTFVPEAVLSIQGQNEGLCFFAIDEPPLQWEVGVAYKNGLPLRRQARLLVECMKEILLVNT